MSNRLTVLVLQKMEIYECSLDLEFAYGASESHLVISKVQRLRMLNTSAHSYCDKVFEFLEGMVGSP